MIWPKRRRSMSKVLQTSLIEINCRDTGFKFRRRVISTSNTSIRRSWVPLITEEGSDPSNSCWSILPPKTKRMQRPWRSRKLGLNCHWTNTHRTISLETRSEWITRWVAPCRHLAGKRYRPIILRGATISCWLHLIIWESIKIGMVVQLNRRVAALTMRSNQASTRFRRAQISE